MKITAEDGVQEFFSFMSIVLPLPPLYEDERTSFATNFHFVISFRHRQIARILFRMKMIEVTFCCGVNTVLCWMVEGVMETVKLCLE